MKRYTFNDYVFDPKEAFVAMEVDWRTWANLVHADKWVLGMSGGKDSLIVAALAAKIFGKKNVYGVMMPCGEQKDQNDAVTAIDITGINRLEVNIGKAYEELLDGIAYSPEVGEIKLTNDTRINLPPRLRMSVLFGIGQSIGAFVLNTDNLSERICGYSTLGGDDMGSYAPIQDLTVTEVKKLGLWLGLPEELVNKKPGDGLQSCGDEERLGLNYSDLDILIRTGKGKKNLVSRAYELYVKNAFKTHMIVIDSPTDLKNCYPVSFRSGYKIIID